MLYKNIYFYIYRPADPLLAKNYTSLINICNNEENCTFLTRFCGENEGPTDFFLYLGIIAIILVSSSVLCSVWLYHLGDYLNLFKRSKFFCCSPIIHSSCLNSYAKQINMSKIKKINETPLLINVLPF